MSVRHKSNLDFTSAGLQRDLHPPEALGTYPNNRNVVEKLPVFLNDTALVNKFFELFAYDPGLSKFVTGSQRIWFSEHASWAPPTKEAFAEFADAVKQLDAPVLVLHTREQMLSNSLPPNAGGGWANEAKAMQPADVDLISYRPDTMSFVYHATTDGWLLVTDRWARSWTATVNGKACQDLAADFVFRAVPVSRGSNTVVFTYKPRGYIPLVVLSWLTTVLLCIVEAWRVVAHRHRGRAEEPQAVDTESSQVR